MKRRERDNEARETSFLDIANCLMLLSHTHTNSHRIRSCAEFECKTCNRKFSSFQALGGHRASHKKPRLDDHDAELKPQAKPKMHECSICGLKFSLGQALGGHMRRHRAAGHDVVSQVVPVLKRSNSKRVLNLCLDLNLTPLENDLKLLFGNMHAS